MNRFIYFEDGVVKYKSGVSAAAVGAHHDYAYAGRAKPHLYPDTHTFVLGDFTWGKYDMPYKQSIVLFAYYTGYLRQYWAKIYSQKCRGPYDSMTLYAGSSGFGLSFGTICKRYPDAIKGIMASNECGTLEELYVKLVKRNLDLSRVVFDKSAEAFGW